MSTHPHQIVIGLNAVILAVTDEEPRIRTGRNVAVCQNSVQDLGRDLAASPSAVAELSQLVLRHAWLLSLGVGGERG